MQFDVITIFPHALDSYFDESILRRAAKEKRIAVNFHDLRRWSEDKHKTVDDSPYGGGAGMIMKVEPIDKAVAAIKKQNASLKSKVVVFSAKGKVFNQQIAREYARLEHLIMVCGRYEGIDQRVIDHIADEELSIGKYVLTGGELPAAVVIDAVTRLLPDVLGNQDSLADESFGLSGESEYPQYTRPEYYKEWQVPDVLISGDHRKIAEWKEKNKRIQ